jgi:hypothetical protein
MLNVQIPEGMMLIPGTPVSVANDVTVTVLPEETLPVLTLCCGPLIGTGLNCLYVGDPIADEVSSE